MPASFSRSPRRTRLCLRRPGNGNVRLDGALYFPTQQVNVGGNGDLGLTADAWAIIANKVRVHGNGKVRLKADFAVDGFPEILPKISLEPPHLTQ
jgi:hypothetical protein